jgi:MFS family permease
VRGLCVLTLINLLNYIDRYVVSALLPALKAEHMNLSDFRLGILMTGFLIVYMLAAPVFGAIGDRGSRTRPIALGVFLWSMATFASGFARNYVQLLLGRALVGIGEAAYGTISPSLLADYFPLQRRGRAFAVFYMAIPVGAALGYVIGGLVEHWYGWRAAFFVAGTPGLLLAAWTLRQPDPPRGVQDTAVIAPQPAHGSERSRLSIYTSLLKRSPYLLTVLGYAAYTFAVGGLAFWMPTFLMRVRGIPSAQASTGFGAIVVVTGFLGTFAGGWLGDYCLRYSRQAYLWMSGLVTLLAVPVAFLALAAPARSVYYPSIIGAELLLFMSTGPINSVIVNLVAPWERASAVALSVLLIHLLGDVASPPLIGALSDVSSLGQAVLIVPAATAVCGVLWLLAARSSRIHAALAG